MVSGGSLYTNLDIQVQRDRIKRDDQKLKTRARDPVNVCPRGFIPGYKDLHAPIKVQDFLVRKSLNACFSMFNFTFCVRLVAQMMYYIPQKNTTYTKEKGCKLSRVASGCKYVPHV